MRFASHGDIPRVDLTVLRRLVPALWSQWRELRFDDRGWVRDEESGELSGALRLVSGRHRVPGATYLLAPPGSTTPATFTLAADDGRAVRGTLAAGPWSADVELGERWRAAGRIDVRSLLLGNDVPGFAVGLIGGREATGDLLVDPDVLEHRNGDLLSGQGRAQRVRVDGVAHVVRKSDVWQCRLTLHVRGRGLLGRGALLFGRSVVRRSVREGLDEFWSDTVKQAADWRAGLADLEREIAAAGSPEVLLHRTLWQLLREVPPPQPEVVAPAGGPGDAGRTSTRRGLSRRYVRAVELGPASAAGAAAGDATRLKLRVHDDKIAARLPTTDRYRTPPHFSGRSVSRNGGPALVGTIRESWGNTVFSRGYLFATLLMAAVLAFGISVWGTDGRHDGLPPTLIGLIATPLFALLWISFRRSRRSDFERDADELEASLRAYLADERQRR